MGEGRLPGKKKEYSYETLILWLSYKWMTEGIYIAFSELIWNSNWKLTKDLDIVWGLFKRDNLVNGFGKGVKS